MRSEQLLKKCNGCEKILSIKLFGYRNKKLNNTRRGKCKACRKPYKDKYREKHKRTVGCCCGSKVTFLNLNRHMKTKKHIEYVKNNII